MKKVFVHCGLLKSQKDFLKKKFLLDLYNSDKNILSSEELIRKASGYNGIICQGNYVNDDYIEKNKDILEAISNVAVGYDNIDIKAATKYKIAVFNTPNLLNDTVADLTIGLIISVARRICEGNKFVKEGKWISNSWPLFWGEDLKDETLGIIGMGSIGKKVAIRAKSFGLNIIYNNRNKLSKPDEKKYFSNFVSYEELLMKSKYVVLLLPLNQETKYIINKKSFALMRRDAFIINVARGKIIKEDDMVEALEKKQIAGAGLDVFEFEPLVNKKLLKMSNVVLMPHAGSASGKTRINMMDLACKNLYNYFIHKKTNNLVNKEILKR